VVLLDTMQSYFSYEFQTLCGIPQIVLEGTNEDWKTLAERTRRIGEFGLRAWTTLLEPILDEFVAASSGRVRAPFWQSIYKVRRESGGPYISGWITAFFPYLKDDQTGRASRPHPSLSGGGRFDTQLTTGAFPAGLARAPFRWNYFGTEFAMEFLGGFVGILQEPDTLRLRPDIGWVIREQAGERVTDTASSPSERRPPRPPTLPI
jgi:hypothetical protein